MFHVGYISQHCLHHLHSSLFLCFFHPFRTYSAAVCLYVCECGMYIFYCQYTLYECVHVYSGNTYKKKPNVIKFMQSKLRMLNWILRPTPVLPPLFSLLLSKHERILFIFHAHKDNVLKLFRSDCYRLNLAIVQRASSSHSLDICESVCVCVCGRTDANRRKWIFSLLFLYKFDCISCIPRSFVSFFSCRAKKKHERLCSPEVKKESSSDTNNNRAVTRCQLNRLCAERKDNLFCVNLIFTYRLNRQLFIGFLCFRWYFQRQCVAFRAI